MWKISTLCATTHIVFLQNILISGFLNSIPADFMQDVKWIRFHLRVVWIEEKTTSHHSSYSCSLELSWHKCMLTPPSTSCKHHIFILPYSHTFSFPADKLSIKPGHLWLHSKEGACLPTGHSSCTISIDFQTQTEHLWYKGQPDQKGGGGTAEEMHLGITAITNSPTPVCCPRLAWFSRVTRFLQLLCFRSTTRPEPTAPWHCGVDS